MVQARRHEPEQGDRDELIREYLPMVEYLAGRISAKLPYNLEIEDLVNTGIIGLIDAIERFDHRRGTQFKTYAEFRVRGAIFDGLRSLDWVPRSVRKQKKMFEQSYARLEQKFGRHATDEEVSKSLGLDLDEFYKILDHLKAANFGKFVALNTASAASQEPESKIAFVPDTSSGDPYHEFQKNELTETLVLAIRNLPDRERHVVSLYYFDEMTMKEIGAVLTVTESRVSQLHTRAMARLREKLSAYMKSKDRDKRESSR